ncbi:MAG: type II secretion system F family protein [Candidatus Riflebacteria bacterium]|nr:type II secretion system F family protein [Candidatus Riflebacteria bacterium]
MKKYKIKYIGNTGNYEFISVDANNPKEAEMVAQIKGVAPIGINEEAEGAAFTLPFISWFKGVPLGETYHFTRLFATLTKAGVPILDSLGLLSQRTKHKNLRDILKQMVANVMQGRGLQTVFFENMQVFGRTYVNLVKVGEDSGELPKVLGRLTQLLERQLKLRRTIKKAMAYPSFVFGMSILVTGSILYFIVPKFMGVYGKFGVTLPFPTRVVLFMSSLFVDNIFKVIAGVLLLSIFFNYSYTTRLGRRVIDGTLLSLPLVGGMFRDYEIAQLAKAYSILIHSGITAVTGLDIIGSAVGIIQIEDAVARVASSVKGGASIAESFQKEEPLIPELLNRMVLVGEKTGNLAEMLEHVSNFYEEEFNNAVDSMAQLIEPLMMVFLGLGVGGIVVALYLPIFGLTQLISKK